MRLPSAERRHIEESEEILGLLSQSNISEKNQKRLSLLAVSSDRVVARFAGLILEVAKVHPRKRRRLRFLATQRRDLLDELRDAGLVEWTDDYAAGRDDHSDDLEVNRGTELKRRTRARQRSGVQ